jgi:hypothetical protein
MAPEIDCSLMSKKQKRDLMIFLERKVESGKGSFKGYRAENLGREEANWILSSWKNKSPLSGAYVSLYSEKGYKGVFPQKAYIDEEIYQELEEKGIIKTDQKVSSEYRVVSS